MHRHLQYFNFGMFAWDIGGHIFQEALPAASSSSDDATRFLKLGKRCGCTVSTMVLCIGQRRLPLATIVP